MTGLAPLDAWTAAAALLTAVGYGAALLTLGGPLVLAGFPSAPEEARRLARRVAVAAAAVGLVVLAARFGSFVHPFAIMLSMLLAVTGALFTLWFTGGSLGIHRQVGLVL